MPIDMRCQLCEVGFHPAQFGGSGAASLGGCGGGGTLGGKPFFLTFSFATCFRQNCRRSHHGFRGSKARTFCASRIRQRLQPPLLNVPLFFLEASRIVSNYAQVPLGALNLLDQPGGSKLARNR